MTPRYMHHVDSLYYHGFRWFYLQNRKAESCWFDTRAPGIEPATVEVCPWERRLTLTAPDVVVALHAWHRCVNHLMSELPTVIHSSFSMSTAVTNLFERYYLLRGPTIGPRPARMYMQPALKHWYVCTSDTKQNNWLGHWERSQACLHKRPTGVCGGTVSS